MSDGMTFLTTALSLSFMVGFFFTVGVWAFCKLSKWAPVNLTINTTIYERARNELS